MYQATNLVAPVAGGCLGVQHRLNVGDEPRRGRPTLRFLNGDIGSPCEVDEDTEIRDQDDAGVVEKVLNECLGLFRLTQGIAHRWGSGAPQAAYDLEPSSGPGVDHPRKHGDSTHEFHGTNMYDFHGHCRFIGLWVNRIDDDDLRDRVKRFAGRNENFRLIESSDILGPEIWEIQKALDDLFERGGSYGRRLTAVDGEWYRSFTSE